MHKIKSRDSNNWVDSTIFFLPKKETHKDFRSLQWCDVPLNATGTDTSDNTYQIVQKIDICSLQDVTSRFLIII